LTARLRRPACCALLCLLGAVAAAEEPGSSDASPGFMGRLVRNRLTLGADWTRVFLDDTRRPDTEGILDNTSASGNFLGSLWGLDAKQGYAPEPTVEYRVVSSFGLGASYSQLRVKTLDWGAGGTTIVGDGDVEIRGALLYAFARLPNRTRLTPYARAGLARYDSRFFVLASWTGGQPGRVIQVDGTSGWFAAVGSAVALGRHVALDAFWRRLDVGAVAARAYFDIIHRPHHHLDGAFPMTNNTVGLGIAYRF
jgi:opacity protein-like surface antigen